MTEKALGVAEEALGMAVMALGMANRRSGWQGVARRRVTG